VVLYLISCPSAQTVVSLTDYIALHKKTLLAIEAWKYFFAFGRMGHVSMMPSRGTGFCIVSGCNQHNFT